MTPLFVVTCRYGSLVNAYELPVGVMTTQSVNRGHVTLLPLFERLPAQVDMSAGSRGENAGSDVRLAPAAVAELVALRPPAPVSALGAVGEVISPGALHAAR